MSAVIRSGAIMRRIKLALLGTVLAAQVSIAADGRSLDIVRQGATSYEIQVSPSPLPAVSEAAMELQRITLAATGVRIPIVENPSPGKKRIVLGEGSTATAAGLNASTLPMDGFIIRAIHGDLYLVGRDDAIQPLFGLNNEQSASAGTYNAVIEFATRYLGARWFMPGPLGEEIPKAAGLSVPEDLYFRAEPYFAIRYMDVVLYRGSGRERPLVDRGDITRGYYDEESAVSATRWGRHLRLGQNLQLELGQSWYLWLPAEAPTEMSPRYYGKAHPEFYAVPGGENGRYYTGSDNAHGGQLCIVNADVATAVAGNMIAYGRRTGVRSFSLSPNDGGWECSVKCCGLQLSSPGRSGDALRNQVVTFANSVARQVIEKLPDARFGLLAYDWTLEPPTQERAVSQIVISDVYNGFPFRYYKPEERERFIRIARGWRNQSENVVLTTYYTYEGFYSLPWSTADEQAWLVKYLAGFPSSRGLRINYAQLDTPPMGALGPDPWILAQLLWDPSQSVDELKQEFYLGAFGPAAGPLIRRYFEEISRSMAQVVASRPFTEDSADHVRAYVVPAYGAVRARCRNLIDQAQKAVSGDQERYRWRVDRIARGWQLAELTLDAIAAEQAGLKPLSKDLWIQRRNLLADPASRLALAPTSTDLMDGWVPLGDSR